MNGLYTHPPEMEMGSSSSTSSNSSDSLKGLKFGRKIYFEDVGFAPPPKSGGGSPSSSGSGGQPPKKGRSGGVQGGQPPRCQVEGCRVDLSDAKAYYSRHKVCGMHSKSPKVIVGGLEQRFCQQCSRSARFFPFSYVYSYMNIIYAYVVVDHPLLLWFVWLFGVSWAWLGWWIICCSDLLVLVLVLLLDWWVLLLLIVDVLVFLSIVFGWPCWTWFLVYSVEILGFLILFCVRVCPWE